jgi:hypothetical protein
VETFGLLLIAVDEYPDPPGRLPSSASARRLAEIVTGTRGGRTIDSVVATSHQDIINALDRWVDPNAQRPASTIVYLVGHGTDDSLDHRFIVPGPLGTSKFQTESLADYFQEDWLRRQGDRQSWTLFVLDCCAANIGVTNLSHSLTRTPIKEPRRLSLWPATPQGANHSGSFIEALTRALATFNENDAVIRLNEVFRRMRPELADLEPKGYLPDEAALSNPMRSTMPIVMNLDAHAELRRVIAGLPDDIRNHFLSKAQGAEAGDVAWYFSGREPEMQVLSTWLRDSPTGMRVVTGEAGSGKSALLGHLAVLADERLVQAYAATDFGASLGTAHRPPSGVFDAALHLTGRTLAQTLSELRAQAMTRVTSPEPWNTPDDLIRSLQDGAGPLTILADALDESQEPEAIAELLRRCVSSGVARVVIGTRGSLAEGPDQPRDPNRRELLDALNADESNLVVIGRDSTATRAYVAKRLSAPGSPYAGDRRTTELLAERVAAAGQPFLFARLVTSELLARPLYGPDAAELETLLAGGHRGVFVAALERLSAEEPATVAMLRALALSRGRGIPETGGTWLAIARAVAGDLTVVDTAVRTTLERAAPYIMLDAEAGQSVYRLAHRTFVEHFQLQSEAGSSHRKAAVALRALVEDTGGWSVANHYPVRYLVEHYAADADREPVDVEGLSSLAIDPRWLVRAHALLGVDELVDALVTAQRSCHAPLADVVTRVLRRSRIALSRDPSQLSAQVHGRLHTASESRLAALGSDLAREAGATWLRMRHGELLWRADLETTLGLVGKIRALAFGVIEGQPCIAIGIGTSIRLWDPRRGADDQRVIDNDGRRVTGLALTHLQGRPVMVVASGYDGGLVVIRDVRSGAVIGSPVAFASYIDSIAAGRVGDRLVVATSGSGRLTVRELRTGLPIEDLPASLGDPGAVRGVSELEGRVVAHVVRPAEHNGQVDAWVVDVTTGANVWTTPKRLGSTPRLIAGGQTTHGFAVTAGFDAGAVTTWPPEQPDVLYPNIEAQAGRVDVRAIAIGEVQGRLVVAHAPDYDDTTLVSLSVMSPDERNPTRDATPQTPHRDSNAHDLERGDDLTIQGLVSTPEFPLAALTSSPIALVPLFAETPGVPAGKVDPGLVALALTGRQQSEVRFVVAGGRGKPAALIAPPRRPGTIPSHFQIDRPAAWPRSAMCYGIVAGRPAIATGSIVGCVWLWDGLTKEVIGGPFTEVLNYRPEGFPERFLRLKGGPSLVTSVALGQHPGHGDVLALAHEGSVRLLAVPVGKSIETRASRATAITAVALGHLLSQDVLVTGSQGGAVVVWALGSDRRLATLTLDQGVARLWVVHGADAIAVQTTGTAQSLYVLDVIGG